MLFSKAIKVITVKSVPKNIGNIASFSIFFLAFFSIAVVILLSIIVWAKKKINKLQSYDDDIVFYSMIITFCIVFTVGSTIPIKNNIETIIKIKLAPRVYIIEYVTKK